MNQNQAALEGLLSQLARAQPPASAAEAGQGSNALLWLLAQQTQSQPQQPQQRVQQSPDWGQLIASLTADPSTAHQVGPLLAALAAKNGAAPASGQEADARSAQGVAGLRAAAQASAGETGSEGVGSGGAFTEVPQRPAQPKDGDAATASGFAKEGAPDYSQLASLLQMAGTQFVGGEGQHQNAGELNAPGGTQKSAKEKNRAAQRRFRERQKNLIQELKDRETALSKQCEEQKRLIEQLQKENQVLKEIMHAKDSKYKVGSARGKRVKVEIKRLDSV